MCLREQINNTTVLWLQLTIGRYQHAGPHLLRQREQPPKKGFSGLHI
jgi:hypothetical protein